MQQALIIKQQRENTQSIGDYAIGPAWILCLPTACHLHLYFGAWTFRP